jgi:predicted transposase YbfD/YdcC
LEQALKAVTDRRGKRGRRYEAATVLTVMVLAKMAGEQTWSGIAQWVRLRLAWLQEVVALPKAPCANSYRYICEHIDAVELNAKVAMFLGEGKEEAVGPVCGAAVCATVQAAEMRHLACDGKELRGSHRLVEGQEQAAQQVFGIYNVEAGYMEAVVPIAGKGYEPAAFRQWLKGQTLQRTLITADALHTQTVVCREIRRRGGDYLLIAKRNQLSLYKDIRFLFSQPADYWFPERQAQTVEKGHGRHEVRSIRASSELNHYLGDRWPDVQQVFQIERRIQRRGKPTYEVVCGLTSLPQEIASAEQLLHWVRQHWQIENRNHWRRDATLGEDRTQTGSKQAAFVIAVLNTAILALLDRAGFHNLRNAMRTFAAYPEQALALIRPSP